MEFIVGLLGVISATIVCITAGYKYKQSKNGNNAIEKSARKTGQSIVIGDSSNGNIAINAEGDVTIHSDHSQVDTMKK